MKLNKKQKRTATIASMAALLAVVLGMGGQTFAKYITSQETSATATVAKWGVVINANFNDLFGKEYYSKSGKTTTEVADDTISVSGTSNKVAPGTSGSTTVEIIGQPEVSSKVTFDVTGLDIGIYPSTPALGTATYAPVKWTVNDGSTDVVDAKGIKEVEAYFEGLNTTYAPNAPLNKKWTISWAWAFSTSDVNDKLDTQLGDEAAKTSGKDATVVTEFTFGIKATIEQLD